VPGESRKFSECGVLLPGVVEPVTDAIGFAGLQGKGSVRRFPNGLQRHKTSWSRALKQELSNSSQHIRPSFCDIAVAASRKRCTSGSTWVGYRV